MSKENVPFIFGYKTHGLNYVKVYKNGNNFIYPRYIPFFGYTSHPDMRIYNSRIVCFDKIKSYTFKILLPHDTHYIKDMIELKDEHGNITYIKKDKLINHYNYNFKTFICSKKINVYEAVKMKGVFLCVDNNHPNGYVQGYSGDYLVKKNNSFFIENELDFKHKYDVEIVVKKQPQRVSKREREPDSNDVFISHKKQRIEQERNFYKFIDELQSSGVCMLHMNTRTVKLYYPKIYYINDETYLEDYHYKIKLEKDIFPKIEIYNKNEDKKIIDVISIYYTNIGSIFDYSRSWYYYFLSISKFILNSIS